MYAQTGQALYFYGKNKMTKIWFCLFQNLQNLPVFTEADKRTDILRTEKAGNLLRVSGLLRAGFLYRLRTRSILYLILYLIFTPYSVRERKRRPETACCFWHLDSVSGIAPFTGNIASGQCFLSGAVEYLVGIFHFFGTAAL